MTDIPIVMSPAGRVNASPAALRAALVALVAATNPGYTSDLPGSLIEDIASTDVGALVLIDQGVTELVNSITPYGANPFLLTQLGNIYGIPQGVDFNTSVFETFTSDPGLIIPVGFTVSDGTHQYTVQEGAIVPAGGTTDPVFCLATTAGAWAVPPGTVTTLITSAPPTHTVTCTNPLAGTPSPGPQTEESYRAQVLEAGLAASQGMARYLKTLLANVSGVQGRLVAVVQQSPGYKIIVGGGDPYQVAYAIWSALFDTSNLVGSVMSVTAITKAAAAQVTTLLNHGLVTGNATTISGALGMTAINGGPYVVTVIDEKTFTVPVNSTGFGTYTGGGILTPNARNITANVIDYPDTYTIPFVTPPLQTVAIQLTWNTTSPFAVSASAVAQLGSPALADYVNSIFAAQPMNLFELQNVFQAAVASLIPTPLLTRMVFTVSINGVSTAPDAGTGVIAGDPESYFSCNSTDVTITQG